MKVTEWVSLTLLLHCFSTFAMTGLIWFIQIVHYPLLQKVGESKFVSYELSHIRLTSFVVIPFMSIELLTAIAVMFSPIRGNYFIALLIGLALIVLNWSLTFIIFVPLHRSLSKDFNLSYCRKLVTFNWFRTGIWTIRSFLLLALLCAMN